MEQQNITPQHDLRSRRIERLLLLFFVLSLPLSNPWVRGDGVGYYAFLRAPLIEHNLDFTHDYQSANPSFRDPRIDEHGQPRPEYRTVTSHLDNHFTVGPAMLWAPFVILAHVGVLLARAFGSSLPADGFSAPYRIAMAFSTAFYGFLGLLLAFRLARQYVEDRWAALATLAIWGASSLPVYMYFNPSWSHAHSAFTVALFLWYWHETRPSRSLVQWILLALIAALMLNVYYANAMVLGVLAVEAMPKYWSSIRHDSSADAQKNRPRFANLLVSHMVFALVLLAGVIPTLLTRYIIYGNAFETAYTPLRDWHWLSPSFLSVLFSPNHGLVSWTPVLLFSIIGLFLFCFRVPRVGTPVLAAFFAFFYFIASYPDWAGISSYGNRFFISLTPLFILGLAVLLQRAAQLFHSARAAFIAIALPLALLVLWNAGLMFQWGAHLIPARGPVPISEISYNQFFVVPRQLSSAVQRYLFRRGAMMQQIEQRDLKQLEENPPPP